MRIVSWNVNGIRSLREYYPWNRHRSLGPLLDSFDSDIICFQETKVTRDRLDADVALVDGYHAFFSFCKHKGGYSGVCTYVRLRATPVAAEEGLTCIRGGGIGCHIDPSELGFSATRMRELDSEGRCMITDHGTFVLFNVYLPNAGSAEERHLFKQDYHAAFEARCKALVAAGRRVVIVGDLNCTHHPIDSCEGDRDVRMLGGLDAYMARPSRAWIHNMLAAGGGQFVDLFRQFHPDERGAYTCWDTRTNARETNYGSRIDYVLTDSNTAALFSSCVIRRDVLGSDHCPVTAEADDDALLPASAAACDPPSIATKFMPEFSGSQQKISALFRTASAIKDEAALPDEVLTGVKASSVEVGKDKDLPLPSTLSSASSSSLSSSIASLSALPTGLLPAAPSPLPATAPKRPKAQPSIASFFGARASDADSQGRESPQPAVSPTPPFTSTLSTVPPQPETTEQFQPDEEVLAAAEDADRNMVSQWKQYANFIFFIFINALQANQRPTSRS